ncbi:NADH dehydrogenase [Geosmithia morbida]|uniref:NADH dehydrogenase n=1 Tax=Geosmithia morbida TaxID=1094350 RepID=A0A9P5D1H5_9HYPO|nr:NADH dehydrogenase [Geosmithia morbida]KAF4119840.1 NADH dehydrogenase [Geosmithia morbida]
MRITRSLMAKGLFGRSFDELARRSSIAFNSETIKGPQSNRQLYDFRSRDSISSCIVMCDDLIGGFSKSNLDPVDGDKDVGHPYARFHGSISTALPADKPKIKRSGYAGFRTPDQSPTLFGRSFWDIDPYTYLALRVKSDGRSYLVNVQTDGVEPTDLHQHRLFAKNPGHWETIFVRWNDFVRTSYGFVVEPQTELLRQKVQTIGIGLTDRVEGPFDLCIDSIWATNDADEADVQKHGPADIDAGAANSQQDTAGLKNRKGQKIHW